MTENQYISLIVALMHPKLIFKSIFSDLEAQMSLISYEDVKVTLKVEKHEKPG